MHAPLNKWIHVRRMYWAHLSCDLFAAFPEPRNPQPGVALQTIKGGPRFRFQIICAVSESSSGSSLPNRRAFTQAILAHSLSDVQPQDRPEASEHQLGLAEVVSEPNRLSLDFIFGKNVHPVPNLDRGLSTPSFHFFTPHFDG
jgi:hypothetical protein